MSDLHGRRGRRRLVWASGLSLGILALATAALAQDPAGAPAMTPTLDQKIADALGTPKVAMDTMWTLIAGMLVFFMNLGFACVESGFTRAKNAVNIMSKNFIVVSASAVGFWLVGWGLMFGNGGDYIGTSGLWLVGGADASPLMGDDYVGDYKSIAWAGIPLWAKFFFQFVFCGTAATIVSGAVAERIKYPAFIAFTAILSIFIYPVVGHWVWGGGWLGSRGTPFLDFAGSTQVHSIGGWAALAGILLLGARLGRYGPDGKVNPIPGHSMPLATVGCFILWFGWFGFNPGSTMAAAPNDIALICATTMIAACLASLTATATSWVMMGKPDLGMTLNGSLAGLVAITAPCAFVSVGNAAVIGAIAGVLVVLSVMFWDKLKIDDPVGALSVHLVNGIFGTLCVGLFHKDNGLITAGKSDQLVSQAVGVVAAGGYVFIVSLVSWGILKAVLGIRVSAEEEMQGLDIGEHGMEAYAGFTMQREK